MRILFVCTGRPWWFPDKKPNPKRPYEVLPVPWNMQFGLSYISALLKSHGHATELFIVHRHTDDNLLLQCLGDFRPDVVAFSSTSGDYALILRTARLIREKHPSAYQVAGGPHITLNPESASDAPFDALCIGEGEQPMLELVTALSGGQKPTGISNLWLKRDGQVEKNAPRPFLQDLDSLPFTDRDIWKKWVAIPDGTAALLLGRGCPYDCPYCSNHALKRVSAGQYVRFRDPAKVCDELTSMRSRHPALRNVYLEVEAINLDKHFCKEMCAQLENFNRTQKRPLRFGTNIRVMPKMDSEALFGMLKAAGFMWVEIGLESGSERVRRETLRRNYANEDFLSAVRAAQKNRLYTALHVMVGIPGETNECFDETVSVVKEAHPNEVFLSIFSPYPGTDLARTCSEMGLASGDPTDQEYERLTATMDLPGFTKKQIQDRFDSFRTQTGVPPSLEWNLEVVMGQ